MSIVKTVLPAGKSVLRYGQSTLGVNEDGTVDVPAYVAKTLYDNGCTGPMLPAGTVVDILNDGTTAPFEANYVGWAYGQSVNGDKTAAALLLTNRGEPAVSLS